MMFILKGISLGLGLFGVCLVIYIKSKQPVVRKATDSHGQAYNKRNVSRD